MAKLVVLTEGLSARSYELKSERTTIGRLEDNAFQIEEPSVSGHHCEIILSGNEIIVKDLNSTNGTYIDDQPVTQAPIKPGQKLRLGQVELRLEDGKTPPAAKSATHTMPIQGGVKKDELTDRSKVVGSPFKKKSDSANKIFLYGGIALGVVIVGLIVYAIMQLGG